MLFLSWIRIWTIQANPLVPQKLEEKKTQTNKQKQPQSWKKEEETEKILFISKRTWNFRWKFYLTSFDYNIMVCYDKDLYSPCLKSKFESDLQL